MRMMRGVFRFAAGGALLLGLLAPISGQGDPGRTYDLRAKAEAATYNYAVLIQTHAGEFDIDPALIAAVMTVESKGDPYAYSRSGAMGLMQLMPATCEDYGLADPYEPSANIRTGAAVLARHLTRYRGDLEKVLAAYNAGPRRADDGSWRRIGETRKYVPAVLAYYRALSPAGNGWSAPVSLPAEETLPPAPPIKVLDFMFETVRTSQAQIQSEPIAENGDLHDAANAVMTAHLAGKLAPKFFTARAKKILAKRPAPPQSVHAVHLTTATLEAFAEEWGRRTPPYGRLVGLAHGTTKSGGHVWIVLLAS
ncbi:MAG: lytic transglycosylase domain-containing protein [Fimbriimonas sp.]